MHLVGNGLGGNVILAPKNCRHGSAFSIHRHNAELITPAALDRGDVERKEMALLPSTLYMICGCRVSSIVDLADLGIARHLQGMRH
jgi:hypothetical protein